MFCRLRDNCIFFFIAKSRLVFHGGPSESTYLLNGLDSLAEYLFIFFFFVRRRDKITRRQRRQRRRFSVSRHDSIEEKKNSVKNKKKMRKKQEKKQKSNESRTYAVGWVLEGRAVLHI